MIVHGKNSPFSLSHTPETIHLPGKTIVLADPLRGRSDPIAIASQESPVTKPVRRPAIEGSGAHVRKAAASNNITKIQGRQGRRLKSANPAPAHCYRSDGGAATAEAA